MLFNIFQIATEHGLILALVALSVALSFRVLDFPDLTVDGSLALGGAVTAILIVNGISPFWATVIATLCGACAGAVTAILNAKLRIIHILAGILVMTMLYSVNIRIMGRPNTPLLNQPTVLDPLVNVPHHLGIITLFFLIITLSIVVLYLFFRTRLGVLMLATGDNPRAVLAAGLDPSGLKILGLAMANGFTGLAGSIFAQNLGFADIGMGIGIIIIGFASLLIGEALFQPQSVISLMIAASAGSIIYQLVINLALRIEWLTATDLKLATGVLVVIILSFQTFRGSKFAVEVH